MPELPIIKTKDMLKFLQKYGCVLLSVNGSHHKLYNPANNRPTILAVHAGTDLKKAMFSKVLKDLGIDTDDFLKFIG